MNLEDKLDKCIWKIMQEDENSTTFQDVKEGHKLYQCVECNGMVGSCYNFKSYGEVKK